MLVAGPHARPYSGQPQQAPPRRAIRPGGSGPRRTSSISSTNANSRRAYGSDRLTVRAGTDGSETWYGLWRANGRRVKRRIGPKRQPGSSDGLTRTQAEAKLRRLIDETEVVHACRGAQHE